MIKVSTNGSGTGENGVIGSKTIPMAGPIPTIAAKPSKPEAKDLATAASSTSKPKGDATKPEHHGQGLLHHVQARKKEFEQKMAATPNDPARDPSHAAAIEAAVHAVEGLLTGDLTNIQPHTAAELNLWLESSKHLSDEEAQADAKTAVQPKALTPIKS